MNIQPNMTILFLMGLKKSFQFVEVGTNYNLLACLYILFVSGFEFEIISYQVY